MLRARERHYQDPDHARWISPGDRWSRQRRYRDRVSGIRTRARSAYGGDYAAEWTGLDA